MRSLWCRVRRCCRIVRSRPCFSRNDWIAPARFCNRTVTAPVRRARRPTGTFLARVRMDLRARRRGGPSPARRRRYTAAAQGPATTVVTCRVLRPPRALRLVGQPHPAPPRQAPLRPPHATSVSIVRSTAARTARSGTRESRARYPARRFGRRRVGPRRRPTPVRPAPPRPLAPLLRRPAIGRFGPMARSWHPRTPPPASASPPCPAFLRCLLRRDRT